MLKIIISVFLLSAITACTLSNHKSNNTHSNTDTSNKNSNKNDLTDPALLAGELNKLNAASIKKYFLKDSDTKDATYNSLDVAKKMVIAQKLADTVTTEEEYEQLEKYFCVNQRIIGSNSYEALQKSTNPTLRTILTKKIMDQAEEILTKKSFSGDIKANFTDLAQMYGELHSILQKSEKEAVIKKLQSYIGNVLDYEQKDKELNLLATLAGILQLNKNIAISNEIVENSEIVQPVLGDHLKKFLQRFASKDALVANNNEIRQKNEDQQLGLDLIHNLNSIKKSSTVDLLLLIANDLIDENNYKTLTNEEITSLAFILNQNSKSAFETPARKYLAVLDFVLNKNDKDIPEETKTALIFNMIAQKIDETQANYFRQSDKMIWLEKAVLHALQACKDRPAVTATIDKLKINLMSKEAYAALKKNEVKDARSLLTALSIDFLKTDFAGTGHTLLKNLSSQNKYKENNGMLDLINGWIVPVKEDDFN